MKTITLNRPHLWKIVVPVLLIIGVAFVLILPAYAATSDLYVNQADGSCVTGSGQPDPHAVVYCTIQDAIDDALDGETIGVAPGIYDEPLNIDTRADLTINGSGGSSTVLKSSTTLAWDVGGYGSSRQAVVRVVDSTNIHMFHMVFDFDLVKGNNVFGIFFWDSSGFLSANTFQNMGVPGGTYYEITSYFRGPGGSHGSRYEIDLTSNTFIDTGRVGVLAHDFVDVDINNNTFYKTVDDFGYAIEMGSKATGWIYGNTVYGYDKAADSDGSSSAGIYIENAFTNDVADGTGFIKDVSIQNNEIYDCQYGLYIGNEFDGYAGDVDMVIGIEFNNIHNNLDGGIVIADEDQSAGSSVTINANMNTLTNNGDYGYLLYTHGDGNINASLTGETIINHGTGFYVTDTAGGASTSTYILSIAGSTFQDNPIQVLRDEPLTDGELFLGAVFGGNSFDYSAYASTGTAIYSSVQDAIDDADPADMVSVGPGTYIEDLVIPESLPGLQFVGDGAGSTTIKGIDMVDAVNWPLADPNVEVLADGTAIYGFTFEGPDPAVGYYSSGMVVGGNNVEIYNNEFKVPDSASLDDISQGIQTYSGANNPTTGGIGGLSIHNNSFSDFGAGSFGYEGIYINTDVGDPTPAVIVLIDTNTFSGDIVRGITTERSNVSITNNTIDSDLPAEDLFSTGGPAAWQGVNLPAAQDITFSSNTVNGFWQQTKNGGGALDLETAIGGNTFDLSAVASSGTAIYSSIEDALGEAAAADTLTVGPGTYIEDLVIPESLTGLELAGAGSSSIIKGVAMVDALDWPLADPNIEVLADGVSIHDFTIQGPDPVAGYYSSGLVVGGNDLEVYNSYFEIPDAASLDDISQGIQTYSGANNPTTGGIGGLYIHDNHFTDFGAGGWGYEGIYINPDVGDPTPAGLVEISTNTFGGDIVRALTTERSNVSIMYNAITNDLVASDLSVPGGWQGINVRTGAEQRDITIIDNIVGGSSPGQGFLEGVRVGQDENQVMSGIAVNGTTYPGENTTDTVRYDLESRVGFFVPGLYRWYYKNDFADGWQGVAWQNWGGASELIPVTGDWDGDGVVTAGFYKPSQWKWYLKNDDSDGWTSLTTLQWGGSSELIPVVGDWDGDGTDTLGFYKPSEYTWYLKNDLTDGWIGFTEVVFGGTSGSVPITGDWDGDGTDGLGFYLPSTHRWSMKNDLVDGWAGVTGFNFGSVDPHMPIVGDWDDDGVDTAGIYVTDQYRWYLKDDQISGWSAITQVKFGVTTDYEAVAGDWQ